MDQPARRIALPLAVGLGIFALTFTFVWQRRWFTGSELKAPPAVTILGQLRDAETHYRERHGSYASLAVLHAEGATPVGDGEVEPSSGYRFTSTAGPRRYAIIALPPRAGLRAYTLSTGFLSR